MNKENKDGVCTFCGQEYHNYGNNPEPLADYPQRCCDDCNWTKVIPARLGRMATDDR